MYRSSIAGLCLCLGSLVGASPAHATPLRDPRMLALRAADLPRALLPEVRRYWSNAQAAARDSTPIAIYRGHGRVRSYQDAFTESGAINQPPTGGLHRAASEVTEFWTIAGARWYWLRQLAFWRQADVLGSTTLGTPAGEAGVYVPFKKIRAPRVGDESRTFAVTWGGDEYAYTTRSVVFRRGRYVVTLQTISVMSQVPLRKTMDLARRIDRRITTSR